MEYVNLIACQISTCDRYHLPNKENGGEPMRINYHLYPHGTKIGLQNTEEELCYANNRFYLYVKLRLFFVGNKADIVGWGAVGVARQSLRPCRGGAACLIEFRLH